MADAKLSALTAREATVGDPFADLLYYVVAAGATDADKQRKTTPFDVLVNAFRKMSWAAYDLHKPDEGALFQGADNGGSIGASNATEGNHPGIIELATGTASNGTAYMGTSNAFGFKVGGGRLQILHILKTGGALSTSGQRYGVVAGLSDGYGTFAPSNFIGFRYRDDINGGTKWQLCCRNGGTESAVDTTVTVAIDTWYRLLLDINADASVVSGSINGSTPVTVSTNISTTELHLIEAVIKATGTTERNVLLDLIAWMQHFTTAR